MSYHVTGAINAITFLLTIGGLWAQIGFVWTRKRDFGAGRLTAERPTAVLSINQFVSSFLAFFSFFLYGACLARFNHYLVWPRLAASLLTVVVLYEIMADRRNWLSICAFASCTALLLAAPVLLWVDLTTAMRLFSQGMVVVVTGILAQGYGHQVAVMRRTGRTGAVSLRFHQFFFLKDVSTIAFAVAMGVSNGWPLLLMSSVSAATKLAAMWHFRWVRLSPIAQQRREDGKRLDAGAAELPVSIAGG